MNADIINSSGKMLLLDKLLQRLFADGHKVLLFSQCKSSITFPPRMFSALYILVTSMLDIVEDWANEFKGWLTCRIDGSTKQEDRKKLLKEFNEETGPNSPHLFLLSTRAGGVGINLTGVIFFPALFDYHERLKWS
jgi:ATP-dependent DNA helicase